MLAICIDLGPVLECECTRSWESWRSRGLGYAKLFSIEFSVLIKIKRTISNYLGKRCKLHTNATTRNKQTKQLLYYYYGVILRVVATSDGGVVSLVVGYCRVKYRWVIYTDVQMSMAGRSS